MSDFNVLFVLLELNSSDAWKRIQCLPGQSRFSLFRPFAHHYSKTSSLFEREECVLNGPVLFPQSSCANTNQSIHHLGQYIVIFSPSEILFFCYFWVGKWDRAGRARRMRLA